MNNINSLVKYSNIINIGIYYRTAHVAQFVYDKLVEEFEAQGILKSAHVNRYGEGVIMLHGGIVYMILYINNGSICGRRFDKIYYEEGIDESIVNNIIAPTLAHNIYKI